MENTIIDSFFTQIFNMAYGLCELIFENFIQY